MFCPECGTQNPDGSKFCSSCATQLPITKRGADEHGEGPLGTKIMSPAPTNPMPPNPQPMPYNPPPSDMQNYGGYPGGGAPPTFQQDPYQNPYPPPYPPQQPYPQQQPYPPQQAYPQQVSPQTDKPSGKAIAAAVLGITSIIPGLCIFIGPVLGAVGAVLGKTELDAIKQGRAGRGGETLAKVGFYGGIVGAILGFLTIVACGLLNRLG